MATPEHDANDREAQDTQQQSTLNGENRDDVEAVESQPPPPRPAEAEQQPETSNGTVAVEASAGVPEDETQTQSDETQGDGAPASESSVVAPLSPSDHDLQITHPDTQISTTIQDDSDKTPDTEKNESSDNAEGTRTEDVAAPSETAISQQTIEGTATGDSTPVQDGASTPSTPRSTPAKPSIFKKAASIQKVTLNKDFLKNILPSSQSPSPGASTTPRPATTEKPKPTSSATKALKPMVRTRLGNMGTSMQRQGSGSSTPKSGRGTSPNFGRGGNDVWSWRKQTPATKEYSEEELQKQGVHLTARLTTGVDEGNKWADMDDDWSDDDVVEETKDIQTPREEHLAPLENHIEDETMHIAPHILESAALAQVPHKREEHPIHVTKHDRFADFSFDRRDNRSPDQNIHGQRQIYNAKLGIFEAVGPAAKEPERHGRRNVEIMQRGPGRRGSSAGRRRESMTKPMDDPRGRPMDDPRGRPPPHLDTRPFSPTQQRRTSFAEQRDSPLHPQRRRDSFISTSGVSDADRSVSNASPGVDSQTTPDIPPVDLIALQKKEMAESRKRAMERRAKEEEERLAAAERAKKKAADLGAAAAPHEPPRSEAPPGSPASSHVVPAASKPSPSPTPVAAPTKPSPIPPVAKSSPIPPIAKAPSTTPDELAPPTRTKRSDSDVWQANRDQEISKEDAVPSKDQKRGSTWGAIGPSQKSAPPHKQQNGGLFTNPNTLATLNNTIGGEMGRRGRNALRAPRPAPNPANVPPPLQGWAAFAGNLETRRAHDNEKQIERNQEVERLAREAEANGPRTQTMVDKWKKVEIQDPENAGDIAGRTVVSVLKSGYVEDSTGNVEVRDVTSPQIPTVLPPRTTSPLTSTKSPTISSAQTLGMQTPTQPPIGDKTPGSRDRSRFFPSPSSTVVEMSPRIVHPIQPQQTDKTLFPQSLFPSFDEVSKTPSAVPNITPLPSTSTSFASPAQNHQGQRQQVSPFTQYAAPLPTSPGQSLAAAPHIGGMTPRSAFSHTMPVSSPPLQPQFKTKFPSAEDIDTVLARLRETMQTASEPANEDMTDPTTVDPQIQTRSDSTPASSDTASYLRISAISQHRDLEISTRDVVVDEDPIPRLRVSLPKMLHTTTRDIDSPTDTKPNPTINIPSQLPSPTPNDTDAKTRLHVIDEEFNLLQLPPFIQRQHHKPTHHPSAFKIQFSESLRPRGDVIKNLVKKDRLGLPYVNFEAKPEALGLPGYAHDNELFYTLRDRPYEGGGRGGKHGKPFHHAKFGNRGGMPGRRGRERGSVAGEASSSSATSSVKGTPARVPVEKK